GMADYYLPEGRWTDFFTGEVKTGGRWIKEKHGYLSVPLLVKENSIVALGARDDRPDYDYGDGVELRIYELADGVRTTDVVFGMDNTEEVKVSVERQGSTITVNVMTDKPYSVRLVNVKAASVKDGSMTVEGNDTIIKSETGHITVTL
ncbi:MAG: alpha-xylosidase, partial [Lachnospiraceae bacterium]|nr:alpha-xylosidase [Lachnospiraceae bacterium]